MGNAEEVGKAMNKAHRPGLGWLWLVSKWAAIACVTVMAFVYFSEFGWRQLFHAPVQRTGDHEPDGYSYFSPGSWERENAVRIMWVGKGDSTIERDDDIFSVPYAAVWKCHYPASSGNHYRPYDLYWMTVVLATDDKNPFDVRYGNFLDQFVFTCEDGRLYTDDHGVVGLDENGKDIWGPGDGYFKCNQSESDLFRSQYYMRACLGETPPGEWGEMSYVIGEPWSIRIEWEEVEP